MLATMTFILMIDGSLDDVIRQNMRKNNVISNRVFFGTKLQYVAIDMQLIPNLTKCRRKM